MSKQLKVFLVLLLSFGSDRKRRYFRPRCGGLLLVVVVLFVDQVCDQLVQSMRILQYCSSRNIVRIQQHSRILHALQKY